MENSQPMPNVTALEKPGERKRQRGFLEYLSACQAQVGPTKTTAQDTYVSHNSAPDAAPVPAMQAPEVSFDAQKINSRVANPNFLAKNYTPIPGSEST